ncbi:chorismate synthase [Candidatus Omnitrophota bacterium]
MLRYLSAGESHGKSLVAILEGMPAGLAIDVQAINQELKRRQSGYGRGKRMLIEKDKVEILTGVRKNITLGSPIAVKIDNKDYKIDRRLPAILAPRPAHADLAGYMKFGFSDIRDVLERASARETAIHVAVGALSKMLLREFKITVSSRVVVVGGTTNPTAMKVKIDEARANKDTVGGIFEISAKNVPVGLGSYVQYDRRIDARLASHLMSIPGVKAVECGLGFGFAETCGSLVHDSIYFSRKRGFIRETNNAGGIEGGITNGEPIILRCCMKPIATLVNPLDSVKMTTKAAVKANVQRSDTCVVEAAGVVGEAAVAFEIAAALLEKFGGDSIKETKRNFKGYIKSL